MTEHEHTDACRDPLARRNAAVDLLVLFSNHGFHAMLKDSAAEIDDDRKLQLAARLEWALQMVGITLGEVEVSYARLRNHVDILHMDAELEEFLRGEEGRA